MLCKWVVGNSMYSVYSNVFVGIIVILLYLLNIILVKLVKGCELDFNVNNRNGFHLPLSSYVERP